jgi:hypothetical protein
MHQAFHIDPQQASHGGRKPSLTSLDSSNECSLDHWLEVYWLVEEEYAFAKDTASDSDLDSWQGILSKAN